MSIYIYTLQARGRQITFPDGSEQTVYPMQFRSGNCFSEWNFNSYNSETIAEHYGELAMNRWHEREATNKGAKYIRHGDEVYDVSDCSVLEYSSWIDTDALPGEFIGTLKGRVLEPASRWELYEIHANPCEARKRDTVVFTCETRLTREWDGTASVYECRMRALDVQPGVVVTHSLYVGDTDSGIDSERIAAHWDGFKRTQTAYAERAHTTTPV